VKSVALLANRNPRRGDTCQPLAVSRLLVVVASNRELAPMCGRFGLYADLAELFEILGFELPVPMEVYAPRCGTSRRRTTC